MTTPETSPWLSVLVPVYNVEPYIRACIESVLVQADPGVEIVVADDASPDGSMRIVRELQDAHLGRIRSVAHARNRGLSAARNTLLDEAHGEYAWFLDSDDVLMPGAIAGLRAIVERDAPDLVLCDFRLLRESFGLRHRLRGELHRPSFAGPSGRVSTDRDALVKGLLSMRQLHSWSKIARLGTWRCARFPEGRYFEDMAVIPRLVACTNSWTHASLPWVGYRQRGDSILARMTPEKSRDLLSSLHDLHAGLLALPGGLSQEAEGALDYFALRAFSNLARRLPKQEVEVERECRRAMDDLFPQGAAAVIDDCQRRGWWLRAARVRRYLGRRGWLQKPVAMAG